jgi:hypothetical protein
MKPIFSPEMPDFSPNNLEKSPVPFPSGNFARRNGPHWKLPRRRGAPGRTGNFRDAGAPRAALETSMFRFCTHGRRAMAANVLTPSTAMPLDRRIAQPFIQIQVGTNLGLTWE